MTIKIMFFDTSALIKMFVEEKGTKTVKWLTSPSFKVTNSLHFTINDQVCEEFVNKIKTFASISKISDAKANHVISVFERNYKGKYFRVIGQSIISNSISETSFEEVLTALRLEEGKNDWDGLIYQSIVNALAYLGGESQPILVTCDKIFGDLVRENGYRVINPMKQSQEEILKIINKSIHSDLKRCAFEAGDA